MRILIPNPIWPHPTVDRMQGANIIIFGLLAALSMNDDVQVGFLKVDRPLEPAPDSSQRLGIERMRELGVEVLDSLEIPHPSRSGKGLRPRSMSDYYPDLVHTHLVEPAVSRFKPDVVLLPISEWISMLFSDAQAIRFAYYGNPGWKVVLARAKFDRLHGGKLRTYAKSAAYVRLLERAHLKQMTKFQILGDLSANDADYYRRRGHPNAFYIQNLWIDQRHGNWERDREALEEGDVVRIIGNVGNMAGTANSYGMQILLQDVLPRLRDEMRGLPFRVELIGGGEPHPGLREFLRGQDGIVRLRGFVDDLDRELLGANIFLCLNNASPFKVAHTRYLHAWSLGSCIIAHRDAALSMPEMIHEENCLLGSNAREVSELVAAAAQDQTLRRRLGRNGYETYRLYYTPEKVARVILARINAYRKGFTQ